jgi:two-component system, OmpR family, response regulator RegX3
VLKPARRKIRVFVVEDHPAIARGLKLFLETAGQTVFLAGDIKSALALAPKISFDVFLCDISLPDGTGWELMKQMNSAGRIHGIAFSAFDDPADVERSLKAGFSKHVAKGAPAEELLEAIERAAHNGTQGRGASPPNHSKRRKSSSRLTNKTARTK